MKASQVVLAAAPKAATIVIGTTINKSLVLVNFCELYI